MRPLRGARAPRAFWGLLALTLLAAAGFAWLGLWQIHRRAWKLDLIARIDARVHAPAVDAPGPPDWGKIDAYRRVRVHGRFLNDRETAVQAVTVRGAGYWILTPLVTDHGFIVLINRGFVPPETKDPGTRPGSQITGPTTIAGLLRLTEPGGGFLRSNDPGSDRWYSRDVAAIARSRQLQDVAPYFIDADATPGTDGGPVGGLTVIALPNNHLLYALTWAALSALCLGASVVVVRDARRRRADWGQVPLSE